MSGEQRSVQSGDTADLDLIYSGSYTVTKTAGNYFQNDIISSNFGAKNFTFLYYVDFGDGEYYFQESIIFDSSGIMQKTALMQFYSTSIRFQYTVYTTALRDVQSSAIFYYKIFRLGVR